MLHCTILFHDKTLFLIDCSSCYLMCSTRRHFSRMPTTRLPTVNNNSEHVRVQGFLVWWCPSLTSLSMSGGGAGARGFLCGEGRGPGRKRGRVPLWCGEGKQRPYVICDWPMASMAVVTWEHVNRKTDTHDWKDYPPAVSLADSKNTLQFKTRCCPCGRPRVPSHKVKG